MSDAGQSRRILPKTVLSPAVTLLTGRRQSGSLELDIGCGTGSFLCDLAAQHPSARYVGIDISTEAAERARDRVRRKMLNNVTVVNGEATAFLQTLADNTVAMIHVYFPTPYPDALGLNCRLLNLAFFRQAYRALEPGGLLLVATDHQDYYAEILRTLDICEDPWWPIQWPSREGHAADIDLTIGTYWEGKTRAASCPTLRLAILR